METALSPALAGTTTFYTQPEGSSRIDISSLLPNHIIDKGRTGCGATTGFLNNDDPMVMVLPYISNIKYKQVQFDPLKVPGKIKYPMFGFFSRCVMVSLAGEILGLGEERALEELNKYLDSCKKLGSPPKILVTPDSLPKVMKVIAPIEFVAVFDEISSLFLKYKLRYTGMNNVLANFEKFKEFYFVSATFPEVKYWPDKLTKIPVQRVIWPDKKPLEVCTVFTSNYKDTLCNLIGAFLDPECTENCYIFLNYVKKIENIVKKCRLKETDYSVIFAEGRTEKLTRWSPNNKTKITFITSSGHESIDIKDEHAVPFVVTNTAIRTTIMNPFTDILQMMGRFRDSAYKGRVFHILQFSEGNPIPFCDQKEIDNFTEQCYSKEVNLVDLCSITGSKDDRNLYFHKLNKQEGKYKPDLALKKPFSYHLETLCVYSSVDKLHEAYRNSGFSITDYTYNFSLMVFFSIVPSSFKAAVEKLLEIDERFGIDDSGFKHYKEKAIKKFWYLEPALKYFGYDWIEQKKYNTEQLKDKFKGYSKRLVEDPDPLNIFSTLIAKYTKDEKIPLKELKSIFVKMEDQIGFRFFTTASDLKKYYEIKETHIYANGKKICAYILGDRIELN